MILNAAATLILGGAAADIEKVRRRHAVELDDVHGRHGEAGAVDHAADRAVERDIVEIELRGLDLLGVFLGLVAQRRDLRMQEQRVVVEVDLGVEADQLLVLGDDQRIDLEQAHVGVDKGLIEIAQQRAQLLAPDRRQASAHARPRGRGADKCRSTGSIEMVTILSGVLCATSSMSMPPSVETTTATREVSRSISIDR